MFDICLSGLDLSTGLLQSSHIPHNETDLSYNLEKLFMYYASQQVRAIAVLLAREETHRVIEQFPVQRTALGENSVEIVVIIISK